MKKVFSGLILCLFVFVSCEKGSKPIVRDSGYLLQNSKIICTKDTTFDLYYSPDSTSSSVNLKYSYMESPDKYDVPMSLFGGVDTVHTVHEHITSIVVNMPEVEYRDTLLIDREFIKKLFIFKNDVPMSTPLYDYFTLLSPPNIFVANGKVIVSFVFGVPLTDEKDKLDIAFLPTGCYRVRDSYHVSFK